MPDVEMNLKVKKYIEKTVSPTWDRNQGHVYLPKDWIHAKVIIIEEANEK